MSVKWKDQIGSRKTYCRTFWIFLFSYRTHICIRDFKCFLRTQCCGIYLHFPMLSENDHWSHVTFLCFFNKFLFNFHVISIVVCMCSVFKFKLKRIWFFFSFFLVIGENLVSVCSVVMLNVFMYIFVLMYLRWTFETSCKRWYFYLGTLSWWKTKNNIWIC